MQRVDTPTLTLRRPTVADTEDYFNSRPAPVQRTGFKRVASDTFVGAMALMDRGTPFHSSIPQELPRFSPAIPGVPPPITRQPSPVVTYWRSFSDTQQDVALHVVGACAAASVGLCTGFVLGLYVALNHLELPRGL